MWLPCTLCHRKAYQGMPLPSEAHTLTASLLCSQPDPLLLRGAEKLHEHHGLALTVWLLEAQTYNLVFAMHSNSHFWHQDSSVS